MEYRGFGRSDDAEISEESFVASAAADVFFFGGTARQPAPAKKTGPETFILLLKVDDGHGRLRETFHNLWMQASVTLMRDEYEFRFQATTNWQLPVAQNLGPWRKPSYTTGRQLGPMRTE